MSRTAKRKSYENLPKKWKMKNIKYSNCFAGQGNMPLPFIHYDPLVQQYTFHLR